MEAFEFIVLWPGKSRKVFAQDSAQSCLFSFSSLTKKERKDMQETPSPHTLFQCLGEALLLNGQSIRFSISNSTSSLRKKRSSASFNGVNLSNGNYVKIRLSVEESGAYSYSVCTVRGLWWKSKKSYSGLKEPGNARWGCWEFGSLQWGLIFLWSLRVVTWKNPPLISTPK